MFRRNVGPQLVDRFARPAVEQVSSIISAKCRSILGRPTRAASVRAGVEHDFGEMLVDSWSTDWGGMRSSKCKACFASTFFPSLPPPPPPVRAAHASRAARPWAEADCFEQTDTESGKIEVHKRIERRFYTTAEVFDERRRLAARGKQIFVILSCHATF